VIGGADRPARLIGQLERRRSVATEDARGARTRRQRFEELRRPQVLVQVNARGFAPFLDV
jgi:hypothetical protein